MDHPLTLEEKIDIRVSMKGNVITLIPYGSFNCHVDEWMDHGIVQDTVCVRVRILHTPSTRKNKCRQKIVRHYSLDYRLNIDISHRGKFLLQNVKSHFWG